MYALFVSGQLSSRWRCGAATGWFGLPDCTKCWVASLITRRSKTFGSWAGCGRAPLHSAADKAASGASRSENTWLTRSASPLQTVSQCQVDVAPYSDEVFQSDLDMTSVRVKVKVYVDARAEFTVGMLSFHWCRTGKYQQPAGIQG